MGVLDGIDHTHLRAAVVGFRDALRAHQQRLNRLNVYPVPDGDTGTNMALTLESVVTALDGVAEPDRDMVATCKAISHGSLMGARGNSGVILSQVLRGLCHRLDDAEVADGASVAAALAEASTAAYGAVMRPVEGTILTVVREASEAAVAVGAGEKRLVEVLDAAVRAWSTPGAPASSCSSTPSCKWSTAGRCRRRPRTRPSRGCRARSQPGPARRAGTGE